MRHRRRLLSLLAGVVLVGALPGIATANTTEAIADTGGMTLTLAIPGIPGAPWLTIGVTLDDTGNITTVTLDSDTPLTLSGTPVHKVTFERASDSTVVQVKAKGEKLTAKVKTSNLEDLIGPNTWTGTIFGVERTVTFDIGWGDSGNTYLEIVEGSISVDPPDPVSAINGPFNESDDDDEYESKVTIIFTDTDGNIMTLNIEVETEYGDDDEEHDGVYAKLKITLRGNDHQEITDEIVAGEQTWNGELCDGTDASVTYRVNADGSISYVSAAPDNAKVEQDKHGFEIEFKTDSGDDNGELEVELESEHGVLELKVKFSCDDDDDDDHSKIGDDDDDEDDHSYKSGDDEDDDDHSNTSDDQDDEDDDDEDD